MVDLFDNGHAGFQCLLGAEMSQGRGWHVIPLCCGGIDCVCYEVVELVCLCQGHVFLRCHEAVLAVQVAMTLPTTGGAACVHSGCSV